MLFIIEPSSEAILEPATAYTGDVAVGKCIQCILNQFVLSIVSAVFFIIESSDDGGKGKWKGKLTGKSRKGSASKYIQYKLKQFLSSIVSALPFLKGSKPDNYGICPVCGGSYGKDLWRHLRNVERWDDHQIKEKFTDKRAKSVNPLR